MLKKMMLRNESTTDRALRVLVGAAAIALVFVGPQTAWGWLGIIPLATGLAGTCPLYTIFGVSTCSSKPA